MNLIPIRATYAPSDVLAAESHLCLISPTEAAAARLLALLHRRLDEEDDPDDFSELPIAWVLAPFSGFFQST
jgi:hypothetical protein